MLPHSLRAAFCAQGCADKFRSTTAVAAVICHTSLYLYMLGLVVSRAVLHLCTVNGGMCIMHASHGMAQNRNQDHMNFIHHGGEGSCSSWWWQQLQQLVVWGCQRVYQVRYSFRWC
jgi:hypothetical protein